MSIPAHFYPSSGPAFWPAHDLVEEPLTLKMFGQFCLKPTCLSYSLLLSILLPSRCKTLSLQSPDCYFSLVCPS